MGAPIYSNYSVNPGVLPGLPPRIRVGPVASVTAPGTNIHPVVRGPALRARRLLRPGTAQPLQSLPPYRTHWDNRYGWTELPAHRQFFEGCSARAADLGSQSAHFWLGEPGLSHRRLSRILDFRGIVGLIIASQRTEHAAPLNFEWSRSGAAKIDSAPRDRL